MTSLDSGSMSFENPYESPKVEFKNPPRPSQESTPTTRILKGIFLPSCLLCFIPVPIIILVLIYQLVMYVLFTNNTLDNYHIQFFVLSPLLLIMAIILLLVILFYALVVSTFLLFIPSLIFSMINEWILSRNTHLRGHLISSFIVGFFMTVLIPFFNVNNVPIWFPFVAGGITCLTSYLIRTEKI